MFQRFTHGPIYRYRSMDLPERASLSLMYDKPTLPVGEITPTGNDSELSEETGD